MRYAATANTKKTNVTSLALKLGKKLCFLITSISNPAEYIELKIFVKIYPIRIQASVCENSLVIG
jgi:hypothetical protein